MYLRASTAVIGGVGGGGGVRRCSATALNDDVNISGCCSQTSDALKRCDSHRRYS